MSSSGSWDVPVEELPEEAIEAEIAALSARIDAALHRMLTLIRRFDESGAWWRSGFKTCAAWLSWRTGLAPGAARERVRVARALAELPKIDAAFARADVSYSKVRAMTRVATPEREETLLRFARFGTAHQLEKICQLTRRTDEAATKPKSDKPPTRYVFTRPCGDGTVELVARLMPDEAAQVTEAIDAIRKERDAEQERVEAATDVPAGTSPASTGARDPGASVHRAWPSRPDALVDLAQRVLAGDLAKEGGPRTGGDRAEIHLSFTRDALGDGFQASLHDGTHVPAETFRRLSCDAGLVASLEDEEGRTLDVGRKTRAIPPAIRRALRKRQPTCAFPGCGHTRFLDAHHVTHWIHGGETKLDNLVHLCGVHHRLLHEDGFSVSLTQDGQPLFRTPSGHAILVSPPRPRSRGNASRRLDDIGRRLDIPITPTVRFPEWQGDRCDYDWAVGALMG